MKIYRSITWDIETGNVIHEDSYEYDGPLALCDRSVQQQAGTAANNAAQTGQNLGNQAQGINTGTLQPFLTSELTNPQGYSQGDLTQMLNQSAAGAGGATSGLVGQANLQAARTGNTSGYGSAVDNAARTQQQAEAKTSEGVAADNAGLKQKQQQAAASGLADLGNEDMGGMFKALGLQNEDLNTDVQAGQSGWLQNMQGILSSLNGSGFSAGKGKVAF